jgi:hypothetical protein
MDMMTVGRSAVGLELVWAVLKAVDEEKVEELRRRIKKM